MSTGISVQAKHKPVLDPGFIPGVLWNRAYQAAVKAGNSGLPYSIALQRKDGTITTIKTRILPHTGDNIALNQKYLDRLLKLMLWGFGGWRVITGGCTAATDLLRSIYSSTGARHFDAAFMGEKTYDHPFVIEDVPLDKVPESRENSLPLGRHLDGCRIGFDLGGSDRKCASVIDGKVVFTEEVEWDPYFQKDPQYHYDGIMDTLKRAAAHLPRVDAIGGSAAGVYVNNEVRVASLFRGIPAELYPTRVRRIFFDVQKAWGGIPMEVVNDGEVTALAGSMSMKDNAVLGLSMGTSTAAGYVTPQGNITNWLNEMAFVPVDFRDDAPADEWSGDIGCGVQYFSQQGVARLAPLAGLDFPAEMKFPERLVEVQGLMKKNDPRAEKIYRTIGTCFGYAIAHWADYYDYRNLLFLGRVTSGQGGEIILQEARAVLRDEFPSLHEKIQIRTPNEQDKRHGQAVAAASLPTLPKKT